MKNWNNFIMDKNCFIQKYVFLFGFARRLARDFEKIALFMLDKFPWLSIQ